MKKINTVFLLFFGIYSQVALSQDNDHVPGELLIMLEGNQDPQVLVTELSLVASHPSKLNHQRTLSKSLNIHLFSFDPAVNENSMLESVLAHPSVRIAQYNHYVNERNTVPNDPQFNVMWGMDNTGTNGGAGAVADADIDAPEAWDITTGGLTALGDSIVVAVIDGGFSLTHPDLNFWKNYDEIPNNGIDDDGNGYIDDYNGWNAASQSDNWTPQSHGTHVAGTVGAKGNNNVGVTGVNWNVQVMPIVYGSGGSFEANVVAAYAFARDQRIEYNQTNGAKGAFVVATNSSFGVDLAQPSSYPLWCAMYDSLGAVGILSAGATANANYNVDVQGDIPTACPSDWLITVTNTRSNDTKTSSAGYGATTIDLGSPGSGIMSTYYSSGNNTYSSISGTSMATPHVAGAIALMYSVVCPEFITNYKSDPAGIALLIKDSLLGAVDPVASLSGITLTGGRLNLFKAVKSVQNYCLRLGIDDPENEKPNGISNVYPNPASDMLNVVINSSGGQNDILICNVVGQVVKIISDNTNGSHSILIDVKDLSPGLYFISAKNGGYISNVQKVIIK